MNKTSPLFRNIILVLAALTVFGAVAWAGMQVFQPVPVPPVPPPHPHVTFDPRADVRGNPLFSTLQAIFQGAVQPGVMGRPNPFAPSGADASGTSTSGVPSGLGSVEEVALGGVQALAFTPAKEGGMFVLVGAPDGSGGWVYEIRQYTGLGAPVPVSRWNVPAVPATGEPVGAITPVAIQEDGLGKIWLLSREGRVGSLGVEGTPVWGGAALFSNADPNRVARWGMFSLDGAGRLWVTDGANVYVGNGSGFQAADLPAQLGSARVAFEAFIAGASYDAASDDGWVYASRNEQAAPRSLQMVGDGRLAVVTPGFGVAFPLTLQGPADVILAYSTSSNDLMDGAALSFAPDGTLWASDGGVLVHRWATGTQEYVNPVILPKQALTNPRLFASTRDRLYALDYAVDGSVLWNTTDGVWAAQVLMPAGAQPNDTVDRIAADHDGNIWAILKQNGLLLIRPAKK